MPVMMGGLFLHSYANIETKKDLDSTFFVLLVHYHSEGFMAHLESFWS